MPQEIIAQRMGALKGIPHADVVQLTLHMNALADAIRALTAMLDADAGVTGTTYTATFDANYKKTV